MGKRQMLNFGALVNAIRQMHDHLSAQASKAVNISVTIRNWLIGCYIREYEQNGTDRARYGETLLAALSERLTRAGIDGMAARSLRLYRQFYVSYPQIWQTPSAKSIAKLGSEEIWQSLSAKSSTEQPGGTMRTSPAKVEVPVDRLIGSLSFSHFVELIGIEDPVSRTFYEIECIRGNWSVRELKRQIGSLYYERSGLSKNKAKLAKMAQNGAEQAEPRLTVRDPYVFEFLGLKPKEVMGESHLEGALLDKLQDFLLELGHGFCFEARQKRILIGDTHGFVDLVFYHRVLKCHVLVELKMEAFTHESVGQLNTYVSWYKKNMMTEGDNPPVGILLCTKRDHALVEYALAGMDNQLFVSKYQLELPKKEEMLQFIEDQMKEFGEDVRQRRKRSAVALSARTIRKKGR
ncbi:MAG TPA: PDDEXK nuclease domain-containing protein [Syntrophorhabdales bacterium]|nr:PDDEXK nuclease domain-containing protein [Syntrophorhabdales bacterium]